MGKPVNRSDNPLKRLSNMIRIALGQSKMVTKPISGALHVIVYLGFIIINFLTFLAKNTNENISRKVKIILGSILIIYFLPKIEKWIYFFGFVLISRINKFKFSIDEFKFS